MTEFYVEHDDKNEDKKEASEKEPKQYRGDVVIAKIGKLLAQTAPEDLAAVKSYALNRWFAAH